MNQRAARCRLSGLAIPFAILALVIATILGISLLSRVVQSGRFASKARDQLVLRLVAESAIEEVFWNLRRTVNDPASPVFAAIHDGGPLPGQPLAPASLTGELDGISRDAGGTVQLEWTGQLSSRLPTSGDPREFRGLLKTSARGTMRRGMGRIAASVEVQRTFQITSCGVPPVLDKVALFALKPSKKYFPHLKGQPVIATQSATERTFSEILSRPAPVGLAYANAGVGRSVTHLFARENLERRAQVLADTPRQVEGYLRDRLARNRRVDGFIHLGPDSPLNLDLPGFSGRAVISSTGLIMVGDIRLQDPSRDSLMIVSCRQIVVRGERVEGSLICLGEGGVVLAKKSQILGRIVSLDFPRPFGIPTEDFQSCRLSPPGLGDKHVGPQDYFVHLAPCPTSVDHAWD